METWKGNKTNIWIFWTIWNRYVDKLIDENYFLLEDSDKYKKYFIQALDIIKNEPYLEKINIISVDYLDGEPLLRIFAKVKTGLPPQREYKFKINSEGSVYLV